MKSLSHRLRENICKGFISRIHEELLQLSSKKRTQFLNGLESKRCFAKENNAGGQKMHEKILSGKVQIKTTMKHEYTSDRMTKVKDWQGQA